jgi:hypothetical protein
LPNQPADAPGVDATRRPADRSAKILDADVGLQLALNLTHRVTLRAQRLRASP